MTKIHTNPALLKALEQSSARTLSHDAFEKQRVSFVMGALDDENEMTREQVEQVLERQDGGQLVLR